MQTHKTPRRVWHSVRPHARWAGWTAIAAAVAFSAFLALTMSPMMASKILKPALHGGWLNRRVDWAMDRLKTSYGNSLSALLGRRVALFGVIGLVLLVLLLFFGLFVGVTMLAVGLVWRMLQRRAPHNVGPTHSHDDRIVDAEYRVIDRPELPAPR